MTERLNVDAIEKAHKIRPLHGSEQRALLTEVRRLRGENNLLTIQVGNLQRTLKADHAKTWLLVRREALEEAARHLYSEVPAGATVRECIGAIRKLTEEKP